MQRRLAASLFFSVLAAPLAAGAQPQSVAADSTPMVRTGFTGGITASGLDNPRYVMSFRPIQRLVQQMSRGPVPRSAVDAAVAGTPVSVSDLIRLGLVRQDGSSYRLAYLYLTGDDQRTMYRAAQSFGASLAKEITAHRREFEAITDRYPIGELRASLRFALVAGMLLNWEGLNLTTRLGLRAAPVRHPNGDVYIVHSSDIITDIPDTALYWESHTFPARAMMFSTIGDRPSLPRPSGIPDIFSGALEDGLNGLKADPTLYAAGRGYLLAYLSEDLADAEAMLVPLREGASIRDTVAARARLSPERFAATLELLTATGYVRRDGERLALGVPLLSAADRPLVDSALALGQRLLTPWLTANVPRMQAQLAGISPVKNGLPFSLAFSEMWHYVFGVATRQLASRHFYTDPRASGSTHPGFVPFVWDRTLYTQ
jgi:hypothetical protein